MFRYYINDNNKNLVKYNLMYFFYKNISFDHNFFAIIKTVLKMNKK